MNKEDSIRQNSAEEQEMDDTRMADVNAKNDEEERQILEGSVWDEEPEEYDVNARRWACLITFAVSLSVIGIIFYGIYKFIQNIIL